MGHSRFFYFNLQAFVYISTGYSNCDKADIDEQIYKQSFSSNDLESMANFLPADMINNVMYFFKLKTIYLLNIFISLNTPYLVDEKTEYIYLNKGICRRKNC